MKVRAIHQFHSGSAYGDAITNGMFFVQEIIRSLGFESNIYVEHVDRRLKGRLIHYSKYKTDENNILLVHHSLGHDLDNWLLSLKDKIVLVYHNITPARFFQKGSELYRYSIKGREQLFLFKEKAVAAIADSETNKRELVEVGFGEKSIFVIPLLFDTNKLREHPFNSKIIDRFSKFFNVLFVGRIVENKKQDELIEVFRLLRQVLDRPSKLILVGGITSREYEKRIREKIAKYNLQEEVLMTGKVSYEDLYAYYRVADVFLCLSEHEGFGVPLIESFVFDVPVVAYDAPESNIRHTLNGGGVLFKEKSFKHIAGFLSLLSKNRSLRREVLETQRKALEIYETSNVVKNFIEFLEWLGVELEKGSKEKVLNKRKRKKDVRFQIEGPFDSSYSLAIVNREMARALDRIHPGEVSLYSTEGYGDFLPNEGFLRENPDVNRMYQLGEKGYRSGTLLRNLYPPRVYDMRGLINLMNSYGWEESEFPKEYLKNFNKYLDALPVMSPYVKKIMIDNGILVPVFEIGVGVDHVLKVEPKEYPLRTKKRFKFLHISSCFPRKGVDVLIDAYTSAFSSKDDVTLVIKTFPNPHNNVEELIDYYQRKKKDCPEIELINKDLPDEYVIGLYKQCDCLVQPTRGEGFGLPMAEAMLFGLPVITTAYGGQRYFCNEENSWLIDYKFDRAKTHMNLFNSYWVEPSKEDLIRLMKYVYSAPKEEIKEKTDKARTTILTDFKWEDCAKRLLKVIDKLERLPVFMESRVRVGWISTWNVKCGIATYSKFLIDNFSSDLEIHIIANRVSSREILDESLEKDVSRVWKYEAKRDVNLIVKEVESKNLDSVFIQYNFGFIDVRHLGKLIKELKGRGKSVFITLHSVKDVNKPDFKASLSWIKDELSLADRVFVHSIPDINYLKKFGLVENVALFPHGVEVKETDIGKLEKLREKLNLRNKSVIAAFGFLLPHKGTLELINAFSILKKELRNIHLLLLNSLYPIPDSKRYRDMCLKRIKELNLESDVTFITDFLPDEEVRNYLELSDIVVYPYQYTQESASGAIRYALSLKKPVLCTPLEIFDDVSDVAFFTKDISVQSIAESLKKLLMDKKKLEEKKQIIERWLESVGWRVLARRLENIIKYYKLYSKITG